MTVYEITPKREGKPFLSLNGDAWSAKYFTVKPYTDPVVYLVNDTNERDYYGKLQLVSVHRTYGGAATRLSHERADAGDYASDLELGVDYLHD